MTADTIATIVFSSDRHTDFATLSDDWNPLHMSSLAARRTQAGTPVIHGMHIVACCLDAAARHCPGIRFPKQLKATFSKPVYVGDSVSIHLVSDSDDELRLQGRVEGVVTTSVRVVLGDTSSIDVARSFAESIARSGLDNPSTPRELSLAEMVDRAGAVVLAATAAAIRARFPHAADWIGAARVGALFCVSRLVGMDCPGLHSMIAGVTLQLLPDGVTSHLSYAVIGVDERVRLVTIAVDGLGIRGRVDAFARHPPVPQPPISAVATRVSRHEFAGQRALIVGGSRGLGELTAKIIAAG